MAAENSEEIEGRARSMNRGLALLSGMISGVLCYGFMQSGTGWYGVIGSALNDIGLDRDISSIAVPTGLTFGVIAAIFAVLRLKRPAYWLLLIPLWSAVTMWLATYAAFLTFSDSTGFALSFCVGSVTGCSLMAIPVLWGRMRDRWRAYWLPGAVAPTVLATLIAIAIPANDGTVFLPLFLTWQSLMFLSFTLVSERDDQPVDGI